MAGSAAWAAAGLVAAAVVDAQVAHEEALVEDGGVVAVDDDGDVAAGPLAADTDAEPVGDGDAAVVDGDVVWFRATGRLGVGQWPVGGGGWRAGLPA